VRETLKLLQPASRARLLLRQIPIWKNEIITGSSTSRSSAPSCTASMSSEVVPLDGEDLSREKEARFTMLETLADHDDELMEQLLEDIPPPRDKVFDDLAKEQRDGLICPVLIGVATRTKRRAAPAQGAAYREPTASFRTAIAPRREVRGNDPAPM